MIRVENTALNESDVDFSSTRHLLIFLKRRRSKMFYIKEQLDEDLKSMPDLLFTMINNDATKDELVSIIEYTKILIDVKHAVENYEDSIKKNRKIFLKYAAKYYKGEES